MLHGITRDMACKYDTTTQERSRFLESSNNVNKKSEPAFLIIEEQHDTEQHQIYARMKLRTKSSVASCGGLRRNYTEPPKSQTSSIKCNVVKH